MDGGQHILTNDTLVQHDGILIVVTLPRHISHEQVTTQSQLTVLGSITLSQDITLLHTLALITDRTQVDGHILVRTTELCNAVLLHGRFEADELLVFSAVIEDTDGSSIHIIDDTITLGCHHRARVLTHLLLNTGTNDWCLIVEQRNCLAHHVRSHQCTVSIIMLQERNQRSCDRCNLLRRHVHQVNVCRRHHGEVGILTALHDFADKCTVIIKRCITLTNDMFSLFLGCQIDDIFVIQVGNTVLHLTVRCLDKAKFINLCIDTE